MDAVGWHTEEGVNPSARTVVVSRSAHQLLRVIDLPWKAIANAASSTMTSTIARKTHEIAPTAMGHNDSRSRGSMRRWCGGALHGAGRWHARAAAWDRGSIEALQIAFACE